MKYRMIGLDLDGTLLNARGEICDANRSALRRAHDAGVHIVPCTGRAWREAHQVVQGVRGFETGVFVTGAAVSDIATGRTLDAAAFAPEVAFEIVSLLADLPEAVLVFRDADQVGHDYLVTGRGEVGANTQWWFGKTGALVHEQRQITAGDLKPLEHALRVGIVAGPQRVAEVKQKVRPLLDGKVMLHSFEAVQMPDPEQSVYILEIFPRGVDKWRGIAWYAAQHGIAREEVAVLGDEINDVAMVESAGCGIAMGNAIDEIKAIANHVTRHHDEAGVAYAIDRLLTGAW